MGELHGGGSALDLDCGGGAMNLYLGREVTRQIQVPGCDLALQRAEMQPPGALGERYTGPLSDILATSYNFIMISK